MDAVGVANPLLDSAPNIHFKMGLHRPEQGA